MRLTARRPSKSLQLQHEAPTCALAAACRPAPLPLGAAAASACKGAQKYPTKNEPFSVCESFAWQLEANPEPWPGCARHSCSSAAYLCLRCQLFTLRLLTDDVEHTTHDVADGKLCSAGQAVRMLLSSTLLSGGPMHARSTTSPA